MKVRDGRGMYIASGWKFPVGKLTVQEAHSRPIV